MNAMSLTTMLVQVLGGLGVFLLGMIVMTDALRALAGESLRLFLLRFTKSPLSGALSGAAATSVLQSSSATIVAVVGFVGAGLISFKEALGVIFGANVGTTVTGWMVVLLGLRLQLADVMLPFIFIGVLVRLFARGKFASVGMAIAGFALVLQGIAFMQAGMGDLPSILQPDIFPTDTLQDKIKLVFIGIVATLITQSSSAGVAMTVTALFSGALNFEQAAFLVIGMDVGTTVTAALAAIGGTLGARRTGISHVMFNVFIAAGAFALVAPYISLIQLMSDTFLSERPGIALVAFHSLFNLLGVLVVIPFTVKFEKLIEFIVRPGARDDRFELDDSLLGDTDIALTSLSFKLGRLFSSQLMTIKSIINVPDGHQLTDLENLRDSLEQTRSFIGHIHITRENDNDVARLMDMIHALDHMTRLVDRCMKPYDARNLIAYEQGRDVVNLLKEGVDKLAMLMESENWQMAVQYAAEFAQQINSGVTSKRSQIVGGAARGEYSVREATRILDALRWLDRVSVHINRIVQHLEPTIKRSKTVVS